MRKGSHIDRIGRATRPDGVFGYDRGHDHPKRSPARPWPAHPEGPDASSDALAAVAAFQEDIQALSDAISESESGGGAEVGLGHAEHRAHCLRRVDFARTGDRREEIEASLDAFEQQLDEIEVNEDVRTAWDELRTNLEQLMTN